jgi:F-type H+-transporting ATPase subunit delta
MKNTKVAKRYALSLFNSALQYDVVEQVRSDISFIDRCWIVADDFRAVMKSPIIQARRKKDIIREMFGSNTQPLTMSFLDLVCDKGREVLIPEIFEQFVILFNNHYSLLPIEVTSAVELSDSAKEGLISSLEQRFSKKPIPLYYVNPALKGGFVVKVGDILLDTSLRSQLDRLRDSLINGQPINN